MEKQTVFRKVSVKDRLPKDNTYVATINTLGGIDTFYHKSNGVFSVSHASRVGVSYISVWLEEIELPTDYEILEYAIDERCIEDYDMKKDVFVCGANYILNKLK